MALTSFDSGSQTATLTTEHTLTTVTSATPGTFVLTVDTANLANGETLRLRVKSKCRNGDTSRIVYEGIFQHAQGKPLKASPAVPIIEEGIFTLTQTGGTGRAFPWNVLKLG